MNDVTLPTLFAFLSAGLLCISAMYTSSLELAVVGGAVLISTTIAFSARVIISALNLRPNEKETANPE